MIDVRIFFCKTAQHDGNFPKTLAEKDAFKARIRALQLKLDEENFEEAEAQAVRLWREVGVSLFEYALLRTS